MVIPSHENIEGKDVHFATWPSVNVAFHKLIFASGSVLDLTFPGARYVYRVS